jgi:hypothetical protein
MSYDRKRVRLGAPAQKLRVLLIGLIVLHVAASRTHAQQVTSADRATVFAVGMAALPDALTSQCGNSFNGGGSLGVELGGSYVRRMKRPLVMHVDTRLVTMMSFGCGAVGVPVDTSYAVTARHNPLLTSAVRLGWENSSSGLRASAGVGVAWGKQPLPMAVLSLGWSATGPGTRFFAELERAQTRVRALETTRSSSRSIVLYPAYHTVRFGAEMPINR